MVMERQYKDRPVVKRANEKCLTLFVKTRVHAMHVLFIGQIWLKQEYMQCMYYLLVRSG